MPGSKSKSSARKNPALGAKKSAKADKGRVSSSSTARRLVWIRAAGHCELCGHDVTQDLRSGRNAGWADVAHILPASPAGPRATLAHDHDAAKAVTDDSDNLLLACPSCHRKIDADPDAYLADMLTALHRAQLERIRAIAKVPNSGKAVGLIVLSKHFQTRNNIEPGDLIRAMSAEGLVPIDAPIQLILPAPGAHGRDAAYWASAVHFIQDKVLPRLARETSYYGDAPMLAVAGLADIPSLMVLGQALGDRMRRQLYSPNRATGLSWTADPSTSPSAYSYRPAPSGAGPAALVLCLSATIPERDVLEAVPGARIAVLSIEHPSPQMLTNRKGIDAFREALQRPMNDLEASTAESIHVFAAIPAALAIEFGAFLTMQHRHPYQIYDRDDQDRFVPCLQLGTTTYSGVNEE